MKSFVKNSYILRQFWGFQLLIHVFLCVCAHECRNLWRPEEDIRFLSSNSDLLLWLGAGNWAQFPAKAASTPHHGAVISSTLLEYLNLLLRPIVTHKIGFSSLKSTLLISQLACFIRPSSNIEIVSTLQTLNQEQFYIPRHIHFITQYKVPLV